jgi:hypothetical protein
MNTKALQILVSNGNPNGLKIVELAGWVGKCFIVPRQSLKELKDRKEISQPGLYLLLGLNEETGEQYVYIGESESFYNRITNHDANKDFWSIAVVFTGGLNRAFVKYLEYRATTLATIANRMKVENKVQPQENSLSEFEKVTVDQYFENIRFILSTFQYEVFERVEESYIDNTFYHLDSVGIKAKAKALENGEMLVFSGATARIKVTESFQGWSKTAREKFLNVGKLRIKNLEFYELTEDTIFKSPSAAAATLTGRSENGWTAWKDGEGKTLDENLRN